MSHFNGVLRAVSYAVAVFVVVGTAPADAQSADSDFCVMAKHVPRLGQRYYQHNVFVMADYNQIMRNLEGARMRKFPGAQEKIVRLQEALENAPDLDRKLWGVISEPPEYSDHSRSCARIETPPTSGEYPIVLQSLSPRLIGEMCAEDPKIRFDISPTRAVDVGVKIEMQDFYDPEFSGERPLGYAELQSRADRRDKLASVIRGLMGIRIAQCQALPASMTLEAVREGRAIMTASLVFLDDGIQILTRDDATGRRLADAQIRAREQRRARLSHGENWEDRAAVGAALLITGLAIMMMNRCNDRGVFGNTNLPDCD